MKNIRYTHTPDVHNIRAAEVILPEMFSHLPHKSVLDIGCGTGSWLQTALMHGTETVFGVDGIRASNELFSIDPAAFLLYDLTQPLQLGRRFDLALCLEVAEHLPESAADNVVDILTAHAPVVLFSAAIPGQGGQHHINEQWPAYWQKKFRKKSFLVADLRDHFWESTEIEWWYRQNLLLFFALDHEIKAFPATEILQPRVHPDLLAIRNAHIEVMEYRFYNELRKPPFKTAIKNLIKSVIR